MRVYLISFILFFYFGHLHAQHASVKQYKAPLAGTVVLKDADDKYNAQVTSLQEPEVDGDGEKEMLDAVKAEIKRMYPYQKSKTVRKTTSALPPTVAISFVSDSFPGVPPDNYSAVSKGFKGVAVMNENIAVHDATTGAYITRKGLKPFSNAVGLNSIVNDYRYDPKVVYDPVADRFICMMLNGINQYNYIVVGFSATNDPSGSWKFYKFYGDYGADTTWFDYPQLSITQNELFFTGNKITYNTSWQLGFKRSVIYQIRKQDGYNGDSTLSYQIWDNVNYNNQKLRCLYPVNPGDALLGPDQYFLSNRDFDTVNDSVFLVRVPDTLGSGDTNLTVTAIVGTTSYGVPPDGRMPDTSLTLATNDGRVLGGFIKGSELQFVSTSVNTATGASALYHGIISNFNTTPTLQGTIWGIDTLDMGYPNISYAGNNGGGNQSIISFDYSGPNTYPGFGAIFFDGAAYSPMVTIKGGDSCISQLAQKEQRWGDYSGSQPDWNTIGAVWVEGIYGRRDKKYGNYMAELKSPYFNSVPAISSAPPVSSLYPNPAWQYVTFEFSVAQEQLFTFTIYDTRGRVVDKLTTAWCHIGNNAIQFNIGPLSPGTYLLQASGNNGEVIPVHTFVRK